MGKYWIEWEEECRYKETIQRKQLKLNEQVTDVKKQATRSRGDLKILHWIEKRSNWKQNDWFGDKNSDKVIILIKIVYKSKTNFKICSQIYEFCLGFCVKFKNFELYSSIKALSTVSIQKKIPLVSSQKNRFFLFASPDDFRLKLFFVVTILPCIDYR